MKVGRSTAVSHQPSNLSRHICGVKKEEERRISLIYIWKISPQNRCKIYDHTRSCPYFQQPHLNSWQQVQLFSHKVRATDGQVHQISQQAARKTRQGKNRKMTAITVINTFYTSTYMAEHIIQYDRLTRVISGLSHYTNFTNTFIKS